jgi:tRNA uridine 5-carboxymethylaminomethyl modification enzyme
MMKTLPGLSNVKIMRNAYAIEYDGIDPTQLNLSLEFKTISGLFSAGQINGSSGYEEAAAQGIIAGINAGQKLKNKNPVILDRSKAYIGVLIDDLVTKGTKEPYRMMTSRAEYRLLLRQDNADKRLTPIGFNIGLINNERYEKYKTKWDRIENEISRLNKTVIPPNIELMDLLTSKNSTSVKSGIKLSELIKRPELDYDSLIVVDKERPDLSYEERQQVNISVKYEGYIKRQMLQVEQFKKMENKKLDSNIDYDKISGLRIEARQKLNMIKPLSIGQASRISGVSPSDISVLLIYMKLK